MALAVVVFVSIYAYGHKRVFEVDVTTAKWEPMVVAIVQGNIEQKVKWQDGGKLDTVDTYMELSKEAALNEVDLIVWPETAMPLLWLSVRR